MLIEIFIYFIFSLQQSRVRAAECVPERSAFAPEASSGESATVFYDEYGGRGDHVYCQYARGGWDGWEWDAGDETAATDVCKPPGYGWLDGMLASAYQIYIILQV